MADQSDPLACERAQLRANFMRKPGEPFIGEPQVELCLACPAPSVGYRAFPVGIGRMLAGMCVMHGGRCITIPVSA